MEPIKLALVGYGKWGRNYVRAARDSGEARVTEVLVRPGASALLDPSTYEQGFSVGASLDDALSSVDAVVYAGHPASAPEIAERALAAGLPVLLEKPAGLSLAHALRIEAAEQAAGLPLLVGHQHLFSEGYEIWRRLAEGSQNFLSIWSGDGPVRDFSSLWDYGSHAVAALLGAIGPLSDNPFVRRMGRDDRHHEVKLMDRGISCSFAASNVSPEKTKIATICAIHGEISIGYDAYASETEPPLTRQVRAFARAVRDGGTEDWRFGARWAVDVATVLEAAAARPDV